MPPVPAVPQSATGSFRFADGDMQLGDVCAVWTPANWAAELRRKAQRCSEYRPDITAYYERWALDIEARLPRVMP